MREGASGGRALRADCELLNPLRSRRSIPANLRVPELAQVRPTELSDLSRCYAGRGGSGRCSSCTRTRRGPAQGNDRVAVVDRVRQRDQAAGQAQPPEGGRHDRLAPALGDDPLDDHPRHEQCLAQEADRDPEPQVEPGNRLVHRSALPPGV